jgi:hypothetical protein
MSGSKERNVSDGSSVWDLLLGQESEQYHFAHAIGPDDISSEELFSLNFGVVIFADMTPSSQHSCQKDGRRHAPGMQVGARLW